MLEGIWDWGGGGQAEEGVDGKPWDGPDRLVGRLKLSPSTTRTHTEACSDPATWEGTGVLQPTWGGVNEPRCFPHVTVAGIGARKFFSCLRELSVIFLCFLITADHRGLRAGSIVGSDQRGVCLWRRMSSSKSLSLFLLRFLSSCHLDREKKRENGAHDCLDYLTEVHVSTGGFKCDMKS